MYLIVEGNEVVFRFTGLKRTEDVIFEILTVQLQTKHCITSRHTHLRKYRVNRGGSKGLIGPTVTAQPVQLLFYNLSRLFTCVGVLYLDTHQPPLLGCLVEQAAILPS